MKTNLQKTRIVKTVCARDCPDTCFVDVAIIDGKVVRTFGSKESPITQGFLCPRGAADAKRMYSQDRVFYPCVRDGDGFRRVSWSEALEQVAGRLRSTIKTYGERSVLYYNYAGNQGCLSMMYSQRLWRAIGATLTDGALCCNSGHVGIGLHYGLSYGIGFEDIVKFKTIVFWGNNAKVSSPHLWSIALKAKREGGATLVSIDPRQSETSEDSDFWFSPYPGSDVALFYGIVSYLIEHGKTAHKFLEKRAVGYDKLVEETKKWAPSLVEKVTHLEWHRIENLCELLLQKPPAVFMIGLGLNKSSQGAEACRAVSILPALLGQERGFHFSDSRGRFAKWGYLDGSDTTNDLRIVKQVAIGPSLCAGDFKFVFVNASNPALTLPNQNAVAAGLSREDVFLVVHDTHWTETANLADVVLPAATYMEKLDLCPSDHHVYVRLSNQTVEPLGESRQEVWVMQQLAQKLRRFEPQLYEEPLHALRKATEGAFENGSFEQLIEGSILRLRQRPTGEFQTSSKKIELCSSRAFEIGANPLPTQLILDEEKDWFILLNSALPKWTHGQFRDVYGQIPQIVWVNSSDAMRLGIKDGDDIALLNGFGEVIVEACLTEKVTEGVLWCPRPLTGKNGVPLNVLASSDPQTLGATSRFNSTKVKMRKGH